MTAPRGPVGARLAEAAAWLRRLDDFLVVGHVDPDLDSIGSTLALAQTLWDLGKRCVAASPDPDPPYWRFLPGHERLVIGRPGGRPSRVAVVVDAEVSERRLGPLWPLVAGAEVRINIDHHDTNPGTAELSVVEPEAAATGELVYGLVRELGVPLAPAIAYPLYAALLSDTGSFHFPNTRAETFRIAAELVAAGVDPHEVALRAFDTRPWIFFQLLGQVLVHMQRSPDGRVAWMELPLELARRAGLSHGELEGLVQYPRMVEGVEIALLFKEVAPSETRVSLRSRRYVDVSGIARIFGGGGHLRSAGCTVRLPLREAVGQVVAAAQEAVRRSPQEVEAAGLSEVARDGRGSGAGGDVRGPGR